MNQPLPGSKAERKKARRKERKASESTGGRELDAMAEESVAQALLLAPDVASAGSAIASERALDVAVTTVDAARFVRKRINEALAFEEWSNEVQVWVWEENRHSRAPLSENGRTHGLELRLERAARPQP